MIHDQTIGSAVAETCNRQAARRLVRGVLTALLAGALSLPSLTARGSDSHHERTASTATATTIKLPPIPYVDSMPWMKWNAATSSGMKVDTLIAPQIPPSGILPPPGDRDRAQAASS